jgi:hypothetical protein
MSAALVLQPHNEQLPKLYVASAGRQYIPKHVHFFKNMYKICIFIEYTYCKSKQETRFSNSWVTNQQQFEQVITRREQNSYVTDKKV